MNQASTSGLLRHTPGWWTFILRPCAARAQDDLRLGGISSVGTVMFTDLRGFTAFSENRSPELVIDALNRYFDETSDAILEHGGTLVRQCSKSFVPRRLVQPAVS